MTPLNVLISLHRGYGLGDAVQMSAVLRHVARHRPHWVVDYQAEEGKHQVGRGIARNTFAYGEPYPSPHYDAEVQILLYDTWSNWGDRPNTRVSSCLHERFGIPWDRECARYQVNVSAEAHQQATEVMKPIRGSAAYTGEGKPYRCVAVHYQGDSSKVKKDLTDFQADGICDSILNIECVPLLLDWRGTSPLATIDLTVRFMLVRLHLQ